MQRQVILKKFRRNIKLFNIQSSSNQETYFDKATLQNLNDKIIFFNIAFFIFKQNINSRNYFFKLASQ